MSSPESTESTRGSSPLDLSPRQVLGALRDVVDRVVDTSQDLATAGLKATPGPLQGRIADYLELVASLSDLLTGPFQTLLDEQERLAQQLETWSRRNADLSEQLAEWAEQHRRMTDRMQSLVRPTVSQVRRATEAGRAIAKDVRRAEEPTESP